MTALAFAVPPEPRVVGTTTVPCLTCGRMGYDDDGERCVDCGGLGALLVEMVACPVHKSRVARLQDGPLLGVCDGCAAETAGALTLLRSLKTTGRDDFPLAEIVVAARQEEL